LLSDRRLEDSNAEVGHVLDKCATDRHQRLPDKRIRPPPRDVSQRELLFYCPDTDALDTLLAREGHICRIGHAELRLCSIVIDNIDHKVVWKLRCKAEDSPEGHRGQLIGGQERTLNTVDEEWNARLNKDARLVLRVDLAEK
jgi:hypothetical protein